MLVWSEEEGDSNDAFVSSLIGTYSMFIACFPKTCVQEALQGDNNDKGEFVFNQVLLWYNLFFCFMLHVFGTQFQLI